MTPLSFGLPRGSFSKVKHRHFFVIGSSKKFEIICFFTGSEIHSVADCAQMTEMTCKAGASQLAE